MVVLGGTLKREFVELGVGATCLVAGKRVRATETT